MTTTLQEQVVAKLARDFEKVGGRALLVGGSVRDQLLGQTPEDFDIEVYRLPANQVEKIAAKYGPTKDIGHHFGVLKLLVDGRDIDISLPRHDSKTGPGHRSFAVETDPGMTYAQAFRRRDFTINAIGRDVLTGELIDPYHGQADLAARRLRIVDPQTFIDDPLRVVRGLQFVARFDLSVDEETRHLMHGLVSRTRELPKERFRPEWEKLLLLAERPSRGLQLAQDIGYYNLWLPLAAKLPDTPQDPKFHPEGDVWTHTLLVVNHARQIAPKNLPVILAAFFHDLGKAITTEVDGQRIRSYGHATAATNEIRTFLDSHGFPESVTEIVLPLVHEHMNPLQLYEMRGQIQPSAIRRLARRLAPASIVDAVALVEADWLGQGPDRPDHRHPGFDWLLGQAQQMTVAFRPPAPVIRGRDLLALGWHPSPLFGRVLKLAEFLADQGRTADELRSELSKFDTPETAIAAWSRKVSPDSSSRLTSDQ